MRKVLLLGAGNKRHLTLSHKSTHGQPVDVHSLDIDPNCKPDTCWDLNQLPLPFGDEEFDELHAYEVLEHVGRQGDWLSFFREFSEYWRILKPDGFLYASVPRHDNIWAWSDPGHTRIISPGTLSFLSQKQYARDVGKTTMTDYRNWYKADFEVFYAANVEASFCFGIKAIKETK